MRSINGNGGTFFIMNITWNLIMPVLHKDLSRLSRDAKKLRKEVGLFTDKKILAQTSLDWVAIFFQWGSWNEMYVAWESKTNKSDMWHDFRRRDKIDIIITGESLLSSALEKSELNISKENLTHLVECFSSKYFPSNFSIDNKKKGLFFKKRVASYLDLPQPRFREGIEMLSDDTQMLSNHLAEHFIESVGRPGCIVNCKQMDATDIIRAFKSHNYKVKIISEEILLPLHIDAEVLPMNLNLNSNSPFSVDAFLKHYLSRIPKNSHYRFHVTEALADFVITLRVNNPDGNHLPYLPSLKELLDISNNHKSEHVRNKANTFITALTSEKEIISKAKKGDIPTCLFEQYQYIAMQISEIVNKSRESSVNFGINGIGGIDVGRVDRPMNGELLIFIVPGESTTNISFISMIIKSLMDKFSEKMVAESEDDIWVFNPNSSSEQRIINGENGVFDFKRFNAAKANLVLYGQEKSYVSQTETIVTINDNNWLIADRKH